MTEPFPGNPSIPLKLRELLHEAGIRPRTDRRIPWDDLPYVLYEKGLYLSGLPASLLFASKNDPTPEEQLSRLKTHLKWPFPGVENPLKLLQQACNSNALAINPRPPGRDVVFELTKENGNKLDVGHWKAPRPLKVQVPSSSQAATGSPIAQTAVKSAYNSGLSSKPASPASAVTPSSIIKGKVTSPSVQSKPPTVHKRHSYSEKAVQPPLKRMGTQPGPPRAKVLPKKIEKTKPDKPPVKNSANAAQESNILAPGPPNRTRTWPQPTTTPVKEDPVIELSSDDSPIVATPPPSAKPINHQPVPLAQTKGSSLIDKKDNSRPIGQSIEPTRPFPAVDNGTDNDSDEDVQMVTKENEKSSLVHWQNEVNEMMDQFTEMLVESGVKLPRHPTRENAYKVVWHELPGLLNSARVTLAGFPLELLPYWKPQGRLSGKWAVTWNRENLDHMVELLENDGIGMENWTGGGNSVVQAFEGDDVYNFTYDDFVNARNDDPEHLVVGGQVSSPVKRDATVRRKRRISDMIYDDRVVKRRKTYPETSSVVHSSGADTDDTLGLWRNTASNRPTTRREPLAQSTPPFIPPIDPGHYYKPIHDPELMPAELNSKYRRQKEIIKSVIAILIYHDIPCIAPAEEGLDFFLPWSNLPRILAARMISLVGWPAICAPVVQDNAVISEFGPASWNDAQWNALDLALQGDMIHIKKTGKHLFELMDANNAKEISNANFDKIWVDTNWGVETGQTMTILAREVAAMDPIIDETDVEDGSDEEMDDDL